MSNVLVIATHPDDEVLGCGGVIAKHAEAGEEVHILVVTRGIPELFPHDVIEGTRRELEEAHALLGVKSVRFLDFPAPKLDAVPLYQIADRIRQAMQETQPRTVYCPHQGDLHGDHKAAFWAGLVAARPTEGLRVARILCYETLSETDWAAPLPGDGFHPTVFVDISSTLKKKLLACRCYRSQMRPFPHPRSVRAIGALARVRGATVGFPAAEGFVLVRDVVS